MQINSNEGSSFSVTGGCRKPGLRFGHTRQDPAGFACGFALVSRHSLRVSLFEEFLHPLFGAFFFFYDFNCKARPARGKETLMGYRQPKAQC